MDVTKLYKAPDPDLVYWTLAWIAILAICGFLLQKLVHRLSVNQERRRFFDRVYKIGIDADEEDLLVDMVNRQLENLGKPTEIYRSLKLFDRVATEHICLVLGQEGMVEQKQATLDRLYSMRRKMFPSQPFNRTPSGETRERDA